MIKLAGAALWTPEKKLLVHRQRIDTWPDQGRLQFFQGSIEPGEDPEAAMQRILAEQLRRPPGAEQVALSLGSLGVKEFTDGPLDMSYHFYQVDLPDTDYTYPNNQPLEVYTPQELADRRDVDELTRTLVIEEFIGT